MSRGLRIFLLVLTVITAGCKRIALMERPDNVVLSLALEVPAPSMVKATVPATDLENAIHDLKIWVFNASSHELVASLELDASHPAEDFPQAGSVKRYSLPVSWDFALTKPRPAVDVFVLTNSASIGLDQSLWAENTSAHTVSDYDAVNGALLGDGSGTAADSFSPAARVTGVNEEKGLPMSGVAKGLTISGEEPTLTLTSVQLERCVSKIRFLFSQVETTAADPAEQETFRVDRIVLDGATVPRQEYVFAESAPYVTAEYFSAETQFEFPGAATVNASERPEIYAYSGAGEDGPSYERKVKDALAANKITEAGTYYIRESGKPLSGTIYYTVTKGTGATATERQGQRPFAMPAAQFPRNHTWTVYAYYVINRSLQLSVSVLPWDKSDYNIEFSTASLMVTHKFSILDNTFDKKDPVGTSGKEFDVTLKRNSPGNAFLYVATPKGGKLQLIMLGDRDAFDVWFTAENPDGTRRNAHETTIDPDADSGYIEISIDRNPSYSGTHSGKKIKLSFVAYTPDGEYEIGGDSECIDQIYNFILP